MMSGRLSYNEDDQWGWIRWAGAAKQAFNGRPGQALLRELETALVALPTKRLITDEWANSGDVCALGALDAHRLAERSGMSWDGARQVLEAVAQREDGIEGGPDFAKDRLHMTYTLAWEIIEANDSISGHESYYRINGRLQHRGVSPESRYERMLKWVRSKIRPEE